MLTEGPRHVTKAGVRILYVPADGKAQFRDIANDLQSLVELVGTGFLDMVPINDNIVMFCDESSEQHGGAYNFMIKNRYIHGDAFFARRKGIDVTSLSDEDVQALVSMGPSENEPAAMPPAEIVEKAIATILG